jgi:hypothetical protein
VRIGSLRAGCRYGVSDRRLERWLFDAIPDNGRIGLLKGHRTKTSRDQ